jgi:hypothetical protein
MTPLDYSAFSGLWRTTLKPMDKPEHFEVLATHAVFRPTGEMSLMQAVHLVTAAIVFAREQHVRKLLVVSTGVGGMESPSVADRYYLVREWARAASSVVRVALVARPDIIDTEEFGVLVAKNTGLRYNVFDSEDKALAWLLSP